MTLAAALNLAVVWLRLQWPAGIPFALAPLAVALAAWALARLMRPAGWLPRAAVVAAAAVTE